MNNFFVIKFVIKRMNPNGKIVKGMKKIKWLKKNDEGIEFG